MLLKEIQTWIEIYNKYKSKMPLYYMHSKIFHPLFKSLIEKTNHYEYKQILKILTYGDIVFEETKFEDAKFIPFSLVLDEEKNYKNINYVQKALNEENKYFEEQIESLKDILDKTTDLCETKGFLQKDVLEALNNYLKNNNNDILLNFPKFYEDNNFNEE